MLQIRNMKIKEGLRVYVYWNIHKNLFSVRGPEGRVIDHVDYLLIKGAKYCVGKKGRERVIREQKKNVHAGVRGFMCSSLPSSYGGNVCLSRVCYDPYKSNSFVDKDNNPIYESDYAILKIEDGKARVYAI